MTPAYDSSEEFALAVARAWWPSAPENFPEFHELVALVANMDRARVRRPYSGPATIVGVLAP